MKRANDLKEIKSKKKSATESSTPSNPYLKEVRQLMKTIPNWTNLYSDAAEQTRLDQIVRLRILGKPLINKYAWAIPDERALNIIQVSKIFDANKTGPLINLCLLKT